MSSSVFESCFLFPFSRLLALFWLFAQPGLASWCLRTAVPQSLPCFCCFRGFRQRFFSVGPLLAQSQLSEWSEFVRVPQSSVLASREQKQQSLSRSWPSSSFKSKSKKSKSCSQFCQEKAGVGVKGLSHVVSSCSATLTVLFASRFLATQTRLSTLFVTRKQSVSTLLLSDLAPCPLFSAVLPLLRC